MSEKQENAKSNSAAAAQETTPSTNGLEDLLRQLHGQIKSSNWLETNTNKLEQENPELLKAWKDAINENDNKN
jgi:hypothetical protein